MNLFKSGDRVTYDGKQLVLSFRRTGARQGNQLVVLPVSGMTFRVEAREESNGRRGYALVTSTPGIDLEEFRSEREAQRALERIECALARRRGVLWIARAGVAALAVGALSMLIIAGAYSGSVGKPARQAGPAPDASAALLQQMLTQAAAVPAAVPGGSAAPTASAEPPSTGRADPGHQIDLSNAIVFGKRDAPAEKKVYVFSDPMCEGCQEEEKHLEKLIAKGNTVYIIPVAGQTGSSAAIMSIMCSRDPAAAWKDSMRATLRPTTECDLGKKVIQANLEAFASLGFQYTPMLISAKTGNWAKGVLKLEGIEELMSAPPIPANFPAK